MKTLLTCLLIAACTGASFAGPPPPKAGDLFGWEMPRLLAIDSIEFPKRLVRNRSYGRVVAEISLFRDGERQGTEYTYVENGDLIRWAEKIIQSARFTPARLDGSQVAARVPVHVVFSPKNALQRERIEFWYPTDTASYQPALLDHFMLINESLAPLLIRVGAYDWLKSESDSSGLVTFEVYVRKDGSRENGKLVSSPNAELARQSLSAALDMQILPPRFRRAGYGCWTRVVVGFCLDLVYPSRPVDLALESYRGWVAPTIAPVGVEPTIPPQFIRADADPSMYNLGLLERASELVLGLPIYYAQIDTLGRVIQWFKAKPYEQALLSSDWEYISWGSRLLEREAASIGSISLAELARLSAVELESVLPTLVYSPGRDKDGRKAVMWVAVTPAIFR